MDNTVIFNKIDQISREMIEGIKTIVQIPSVQLSPEMFGKDIKEALNWTLILADHLGFYTKNIDHYMGYASLGKRDSQDYICAIGHCACRWRMEASSI